MQIEVDNIPHIQSTKHETIEKQTEETQSRNRYAETNETKRRNFNTATKFEETKHLPV